MAWLELVLASGKSSARVLFTALMAAAVSLVLFCLTILLTGHLWLGGAAALSQLLLFALLGGRDAPSQSEQVRRFLLTLSTEFFLAPPVAILWLQRIWNTITRHRPFGEGMIYAALAAAVFALVVAVGGLLLGATCLTGLSRLQPLPALKWLPWRRARRKPHAF